MNVEQTVRDYLPEIMHMSLGTCANNRPWVCEVHFVYDDELNLYFRSLASRRHSQEIAANPYVAGNIVTQHPNSLKPRGVYFEGTAELMSDVDENHPAYKAFCQRLEKDGRILEEAKNPEGTRFYKITVSDYYLLDARDAPFQKYHLPWKK
jgi:uncharacterized protein YhbP (UPF0306 family)